MSTSISTRAERLEGDRWIPVMGKSGIPAEAINLGEEYHLFAVLAGVRAETFLRRYGAKIKPISKPRGLPEDISLPLKSYFSGSHGNYSWLLAQELLNFAWEKHTVMMRGYVDKQFAHLFSGYDSFPHEALSVEAVQDLGTTFYSTDFVDVSWIETYREGSAIM